MKTERIAIKEWAIENLINNNTTVYKKELDKPIQFTIKGIKEAINQPHKHYVEKNEAIYRIVDLISDSIYIKQLADNKGRFNCFHYLEIEIQNEPAWIVLREKFDGTIDFYTIVDFLK